MRAGALAGLLALALALVAGLSALAADLRADGRSDHADQRLYLPDGDFLRVASLGFHAPAADYAWLQTVQYYGGYRQGEHDLRYLDGLVDAVVTLDPRFEDAYIVSALIHCLDDADTDAAVDVLKRGLVHNPDSWRLHFEVGFVYYVFTREFGRASAWFAAAAKKPGASDFCRRFAAWSANRDGDLLGALYLWQNLLQTTDNPDMRDLATRQVEQIEATLNGAPMPGQVGPPSPSQTGGSR
jgi:hypothetical protein